MIYSDIFRLMVLNHIKFNGCDQICPNHKHIPLNVQCNGSVSPIFMQIGGDTMQNYTELSQKKVGFSGIEWDLREFDGI